MIQTELSLYYLTKNEPQKSCLLALRDIIMNEDPNITETQKYGMPCFCYKKKAFCYLWIDKKTEEPYILVVEGKYLEYSELKTGNRSRMKTFQLNPSEDLPIQTIKTILNDALNLYRKGIIKIK